MSGYGDYGIVDLFREPISDGLDYLYEHFVDDELPRLSNSEYEECSELAHSILDQILLSDPDGFSQWLSDVVLIDGYDGVMELEVRGGHGLPIWRFVRLLHGHFDTAIEIRGLPYDKIDIVAILIRRELQAFLINNYLQY